MTQRPRCWTYSWLGRPDMSEAERRLFAASIVMRVDAVTVELVHALRSEGVQAILLKGPAIADWLYEELGDRIYQDSDLLVAPDDLATAERVLRNLGFEPGQRGWLSKSREWRREPNAADLHTSLYGVEVDDAAAWSLLSADSETIDIDGTTVAALGLTARTFHLATHAAQHEGTFAVPQDD